MFNRFDPKKFYKYFFYLFIFAIPLQTRKVFLTDYSFYTGAFTESGSIFVYLSDILFVSAILSYVIWNRTGMKGFIRELNAKSKSKDKRILISLVILIVWCFLSAIINQDYLIISLFRSIKMVEMATLFFFVYLNFKDRRFLLSSLFIVILTATFQSIIAISQFMLQHSVFISPLLHKLTGETIFTPQLPGIAKITADGENILRAYGTLPHPNILGGFLVFSITVSLYNFLCHHTTVLSSLSDWFNLKTAYTKQKLASMFWITTLTLQFTALLFTFSRSAWIAAILSSICFCLIYRKTSKIVSRETIANTINRKDLVIASCVIIAVLSLNFDLFFNRATEGTSYPQDIHNSTLPQNSTFNDRMFFNIVSRETIHSHTLWGSGTGTSLFQINDYLQRHNIGEPMAPWQYQPTHNIYLLMASEIGIFGLLVFSFIIIEVSRLAYRKIVSRETIQNHRILISLSLSCLLGFLLIGTFDHYLMTIQQGQLLFWIILGIMLS